MRNMTCMEIVPYSGENLRALRENVCRYSRKELADLCGIGESTIQSYEEERSKPGLKAMASIGMQISKRLNKVVVFSADWSEKRIKEYESPDFSESADS